MAKKILYLLVALWLGTVVSVTASNDYIESAFVSAPEQTSRIDYLYNDSDKELKGYQKKIKDGSAWKNSEYVQWEKDTDGRKTVETIERWSNNQWKLAQELTFAYDTDGNKTEEILSVADAGGTLTNSSRTTWTYTGGALAQALLEKWQVGAWIPQTLTEYTYTGSQLGQIKVSNSVSGSYKTVAVTSFAYDASGNVLSQTIQTPVAGSDPEELENDTRDLYFYENGLLIIKSSQRWDKQTATWKNTVRLVYEYDSELNVSTLTTENWTQSWDNASQEIYVYDEYDKLLEKTYRNWIFTMWFDVFHETYTYDANGNTQLAEFETLFWAGTFAPQVASFMPLSYHNTLAAPQTDRLSAYRIEVTYTDSDVLPTNGGNQNTEESVQVSIYPNPSPDGYFYINTLEVRLLSYEVFDMVGRKVIAKIGEDGFIDLSRLPAGVYNAVLRTDQGIATRKLIRK